MRVLEIIACLAVGVALAFAVVPASRQRVVLALGGAGLAAIVGVAQLLTDRARWQLAGVGVAAVLALILVAWRLGRPHHIPAAVAHTVAVLASFALVSSTALAALMPVYFLPQPTGPSAIGTTVFEVTDDTRPEIFTREPHDRRTLVVQAWYPADTHAGGPIEPYVRDKHTFDGLLDYARAPRFLLRYLRVAPTHAVTDAPLAGGNQRLPVVVFLTGNLGYRQSNLIQVEELVSHGYVVLGIDQPGSASSVLLADGRRIPYVGDSVLRPLVDQSIAPTQPVPSLFGVSYPRGIASCLAADPAAVLDHLADLGVEDGPLAGRLDLDRVGAFGVSLGGNVLSQWCATDRRLGACLFVDAPVTVDALTRGLDAPALWLTRPPGDMSAEGWPAAVVERYTEGQRALYNETRAAAWYVEIPGILHADLTDAPFGSPLFQLSGMTGPSDPHLHDVMRTSTLAFFDLVLHDKPDALDNVLDTPPAQWPEVVVTSHR